MTTAETEHKLPSSDPMPEDTSAIMSCAKDAWERKEQGVSHDDEFDITPELAFWKDGELQLIVAMNRVSRDDALVASRIIAPALKPTQIILSVDAHVSNEANNPATGQPWGPGEMQTACNNDGACDLGVITDCIITHEVNVDGSFGMLCRKYHINHSAKEVHWVAEDGQKAHYMVDDGKSESKLTGYVVECLRESLEISQKAGSDGLAREMAPEFNIPDHLIDVHNRCVVAKLFLSIIGGAVLVPAANDEEAKIIEESLTKESVMKMVEKFRPLIHLVRLKFGLDDPDVR